MIIENETPPSIAELLKAAPPAPQHIALNVRVTSRQGERAYWMTEGGTVFFRNLEGQLRRATTVEARNIMKGLELARRSPAFTVQGQVVEAAELDLVRGLVEN